MASEIDAAAERKRRHIADTIHAKTWWDYVSRDCGLSQEDRDNATLADAYLARLAADRAEREERSRPIDAEWLESIGAVWFGDYLGFDLPPSARLEVMRDYGAMTVECGLRPKHTGGWAQINPLRNRGDVLDLLRVLKGGV